MDSNCYHIFLDRQGEEVFRVTPISPVTFDTVYPFYYVSEGAQQIKACATLEDIPAGSGKVYAILRTELLLCNPAVETDEVHRALSRPGSVRTLSPLQMLFYQEVLWTNSQSPTKRVLEV